MLKSDRFSIPGGDKAHADEPTLALRRREGLVKLRRGGERREFVRHGDAFLSLVGGEFLVNSINIESYRATHSDMKPTHT